MKFWDASAVIPLCLKGPQTPVMKKIAQEDGSLVVWWGTPAECYSAIARLRREGILDATTEGQARRVLTLLKEAWTEVEAGHNLRETVWRVLSLHPLHAADSLQLAAALIWTQGRPVGQHFVCLDHRLRKAAQREGFEVLPAG